MPRRKRKGRSAKAARRGLLGMSGAAARKSRRAKKTADVLDEQEKAVKQIRAAGAAKAAEIEKAKQPHSFVIHRGNVGKYIKALENDIRQIMDPFTAKHLKTLKRNNIKDFVVHGAVLGVTNMMVLTSSDTSVQLRMMRFNQGPTLTFRVHEYSLARHILSMQKRPLVHQKLFERPPLVVMNGFSQSGKKHLLLVETFVQHMFPSINIDTLEIRTVKRCVMFNYFEEDDTIELRHYAIRAVAAGMNKSVKKLVQAGKSTTKGLPDLSKYTDIADFLLNPGQLSDSEYEGEQEEVVLSQNISEQTGTLKGEKSHIRLMEIGPRLRLELIKVQDGIDEGEVLYHKLITKTSQELEQLKKDAPKRVKIKKRMEKEKEHRVIRRLELAKEAKMREEEELKALTEKAARKQAAATGQTEDIENTKEKDREIAMNRERELKRNASGGGDGQNRSVEPEKKRRRPDFDDNKRGKTNRFKKEHRK
ncbi:unnamed protein product [Nippostrongylus brasiliensis]|uniref:Protein Peter pan (inferred by orthology to a D. melanogaster protein) n=1 Tax=Nippostrongylus brasiliensis TaxID=27835 RepID=A0A0N4YJZ0_NIPBR|nr:unnamed protein product [Nippostrongylus brasiliensis]